MSHVERETPSHNQLSIRLHAARGHSSPCFGGPTQFRHIITVVHSMHCTVFVCVCSLFTNLYLQRNLVAVVVIATIVVCAVVWCVRLQVRLVLASLSCFFFCIPLSLFHGCFLFVRVFSMHLKYVIHILLCHSISSY